MLKFLRHKFPLSELTNSQSNYGKKYFTSAVPLCNSSPKSPMSKLTSPHSSPHQFTPPFSPKLHPRPPFPTSKPLSSSTTPPPAPPSPEAPPPLALLRAVADWADEIKERGVRRQRKLYTPPEWAEHRSSRRHLRHLLSSLSSRVILSLVPPVSTLTAAAAVLTAYNSAVSNGVLPPFFPLLHSSSLPYQLTAPALALLLVFRTEASYARFQEGRQAWMKVIAGAGEMARMMMSTSLKAKDGTGAGQESLRRAVLSYIMAFPVALKVQFRI